MKNLREKGILIIFILISNLVLSQNKYLKKVEQRANWEPKNTESGPSCSVLIKITHDVFFGEPTETNVAGKFELGSYIMYKGNRINVSSLPTEVINLIKFHSVDISYDIISLTSNNIVSTKYCTTVIEFDVAGSPNWNKMFPNVTAEDAKMLFQNGYSIDNIKITKLNYSLPNLDKYIDSKNTVTQKNTTQNSTIQNTEKIKSPVIWTNVQYTRKNDSIIIKYPNNKIESFQICKSKNEFKDESTKNSTCSIPNFYIEASSNNHCATALWTCPSPLLGTLEQGYKPLVNTFDEVYFEYKKAENSEWRTIKMPGCTPIGSYCMKLLEPCTKYQIRMKAKCSDGIFSNWSNVLEFMSNCIFQNDIQITNIQQQNVDIVTSKYTYLPSSSYSCDVLCDNLFNDISILEYSTNGMDWKIIEYYQNKFTLENLLPNTNYRVRSKTKFTNGQFSNYCNDIYFTTLK